MLLPVASKMRSPSKPSMVTSARSQRFVECLAAVNRASNCRWVSPSVGDSAGTVGPNVVGWGVLEHAVNDARPVEPSDHGHAA